jgi:plasmid stabilization system protein ParE
VKVHWTATARRHLRGIHDHIARDSPVYARNVVARIIDRSAQVAAFPESGRRVPEYGRDSVREVFEDPYRVIYRIKKDSVDVIAVVHGARQLRR